jgi:hypothetical protein
MNQASNIFELMEGQLRDDAAAVVVCSVNGLCA